MTLQRHYKNDSHNDRSMKHYENLLNIQWQWRILLLLGKDVLYLSPIFLLEKLEYLDLGLLGVAFTLPVLWDESSEMSTICWGDSTGEAVDDSGFDLGLLALDRLPYSKEMPWFIRLHYSAIYLSISIMQAKLTGLGDAACWLASPGRLMELVESLVWLLPAVVVGGATVGGGRITAVDNICICCCLTNWNCCSAGIFTILSIINFFWSSVSCML